MWQSTKNRAERNGIPFNLDKSDFVIPVLCPALGVPLKARTRHAPSIDRIIPSLGYVKGNVHIISKKANEWKSDCSAEELRKIADYIDSKKPSV